MILKSMAPIRYAGLGNVNPSDSRVLSSSISQHHSRQSRHWHYAEATITTAQPADFPMRSHPDEGLSLDRIQTERMFRQDFLVGFQVLKQGQRIQVLELFFEISALI